MLFYLSFELNLLNIFFFNFTYNYIQDYHDIYDRPSGSSTHPGKPAYEHFDKLKFLMPTMKKRVEHSNFEQVID